MSRLIQLQSDVSGVAQAAADAFIHFLAHTLETQAEAHVSITGGTAGIKTLEAIGSHESIGDVDWSRVHIWWGDERFVNGDSADRNAVQAYDGFLAQLPLAHDKVHVFPAADEIPDLDAAASNFAEHVQKYAGAGFIDFDLTLLGMGPDGHIASLFPGKVEPGSGVSIYAEHDSPKPPAQRLSFSYEAINRSKQIWFLVAGADKADAAAVPFSDNPTALPVGRVAGIERTIWFIDQAAASQIDLSEIAD
ncbi:MAG: 6-phosphogluconolactonase [Micrococcales bacterium]